MKIGNMYRSVTRVEHRVWTSSDRDDWRHCGWISPGSIFQLIQILPSPGATHRFSIQIQSEMMIGWVELSTNYHDKYDVAEEIAFNKYFKEITAEEATS